MALDVQETHQRNTGVLHVTEKQQDTRSVFTKVFACIWRQELTINSREQDV